jgi:hypothetical protein
MRWHKIEDKDTFVSQRIMKTVPVKGYTKSIPLALEVAERARTMLPQASLTITLNAHGAYDYSVNLIWAISVQDGSSSFLDTKNAWGECNRDGLAETICFVVAQAVGVVENELEC